MFGDPHTPSQTQHDQKPVAAGPFAGPGVTATAASPPANSKVMAWVAGHRKFLAAAAGGLATGLTDYYGTHNPYVIGVLFALSALGVHTVPNAPAAGRR